MTKKFQLDHLEERLNVRFNDKALLTRSLTHSSAQPPDKNNERLEFLGDRVLGLAIAELLHEKFPGADEGDLAKRFNGLVRRGACAEVAQQVGLGQYLILGSGEDTPNGRAKPSILADACEALLGALFLDQGFKVARNFIHREWAPLVEKCDLITRDPKSALQEWAQGRDLNLPKYKLVSRTGPDHAPEFTVEVIIDGVKPARAKGASKRNAEQAAAEAVILREKILKPDVCDNDGSD